MHHQHAWIPTQPEPTPIIASLHTPFVSPLPLNPHLYDSPPQPTPIPHHHLPPPHIHPHPHLSTPPPPTTTTSPTTSPPSIPSPNRSPQTEHQLWQLQQLLRPRPSPSPTPNPRTKPVDALGPSCLIALYFTTLTRTLLRNRAIPLCARLSFLSPQVRYNFTQLINGKWKNVPTVQLPFESLCAAGDWLTSRIALPHPNFKSAKDILQTTLTHAWQTRDWTCVINMLGEGNPSLADLLECDAVAGKPLATPPEYIDRLNCHKGAADIRRDVDGAIAARRALHDVLEILGLKSTAVSAGMFRRVVSPAWKQRCLYVATHCRPNCCSFYEGGYFKKLMSHSQLYGDSAALSVQEVLEGLDEVIKLWNNPGGMCVREAKCAAGLRYNVDKSFQSGVRSYVKARFLKEAPVMINKLHMQEQSAYHNVKSVLRIKRAKYFRCREELDAIEMSADALLPRICSSIVAAPNMHGTEMSVQTLIPHLPPPPPPPPPQDTLNMHMHAHLQPIYGVGDGDVYAAHSLVAAPAKKRKRVEFEDGNCPTTPREQKRKHAHLSLKRKEANENNWKRFLEEKQHVCNQLQLLLDTAERHGECCSCEDVADDGGAADFPTTENTPVA